MPTRRASISPTSAGEADADRVRALLLWCRDQNIHVGRLRIGDVELDGIADMARLQVPAEVPARAATDLRAVYGADALERLMRDRKRDQADSDVTLPATLADL